MSMKLTDYCRKPNRELPRDPEPHIPMSQRVLGAMVDGQFHSVKSLADQFAITDQDIHNITMRQSKKKPGSIDIKNHRGVRYYRFNF